MDNLRNKKSEFLSMSRLFGFIKKYRLQELQKPVCLHFFSRLAQAEKRTKTKGFWSSCNLYFLSMHIVLHFYVSCLLLQILYLAPILGGDQCQWLQDVRKYCQATGTGIGDWGMGIERCPQYQVMTV